MQRTVIALAFALAALAPPTFAREDLEAPPPLPEEASPAGEPVPLPDDAGAEVRIIEQPGQTIEEYRINGRLYQIKVTPRVGPPYYLLFPYGEFGPMFRQDFESGLVTPYWKIFQW